MQDKNFLNKTINENYFQTNTSCKNKKQGIKKWVNQFNQFIGGTLVLICAHNINFQLLDLDSVFNLLRAVKYFFNSSNLR